MNLIKAYHTHYVVPNYELGQCKFLEEKLSVWDDTYFKYKPKGFIYNKEKKELYIERGVDPEFLKNTLKMEMDVEYCADKAATTSFRLFAGPRDEYQKIALAFLLGKDKYSYTRTRSQVALIAPTDSGKTYTTIAALHFMKMKAIIIVGLNRLKEQWIKSVETFTSIKPEEMCDIDGASTIKKIMKNGSNCKIFFITHASINAWGRNHGWESVHDLFKKLEVGVKVYDEAHLNFDNIIRTDIYTNTKKTIYLTATFDRSDKNESDVFNICFNNIVRYGQEIKKVKRRHQVYIPILYDSKPTLEERTSCKGLKSSLDRNKYSDYIMSKNIIFDVILYALHILRDNEGKILILSSKISSVEEICNFMKNAFPDKNVAMYHSKQSLEENEKVHDADIISATPKAFGTGIDIKGLRIIIMLEPFSSNVNAEQFIGRLREYASDAYTFYVEPIDEGFPQSKRMYSKRKKVLKKKCAKILELSYRKG